MTESDLVAAGYRKWSNSGPWTNADCFYQKAIRSPDGRLKLYFVNVGVWDYSTFSRWPSDQNPIRFAVQVEFYRSDGKSVRVELSVEEGDTVDGMEAELAGLYRVNGFVYDPHNNDGE